MSEAASTKLPKELISAYQLTDYVVFTDPEIWLHIEHHNPQLAKLLSEHGCSAAAFITAFNPFGEQLSETENQQANDRLEVHLKKLELIYFEGEGRGSEGDWPPEPSFLVLGIDREEASNLGRIFQQNAIVWAGAGANPELILLR
ncbi:DUF3293 domain-containing protein [Qipengyuania sp. 1NDW9]|uniref:DUF3293 domain-containing protein n=1 Tax=Qipengyuania xiapuensis TaxID=2867236 RepID=UPI001C87E564|nr:DUF3293 domain-containing protein [Qipengyuania xiapuensis]MBX7492062.1 DUF3293 domain-containing protein [Qipengyuania xiapuensis]